MEIGQVYELEIQDISNEGEGIGHIDRMAVFVPGVTVGDTVKVELTKMKKNYVFAKLLEVIKPSRYRTDLPCRYAEACGGCTFQRMSYEGQLILKEKQIRDRLIRLAGIEDPKMNPIIGMDKPFRYRNKAQFPINCGGIVTRKGGIIENLGTCAIGFYKMKTHEVVNCDECLIQAPPAETAAKVLREFIQSDNITAYDPKWGKGLMRHLVVKTAFGTGEVMIILVVNGRGIPNSNKLVEMLDDAISKLSPREDGSYYSLESVVLNVNKKKGSEIMGEQCMTLAGKPTILEKVGNLNFEISPLSFYQVNPVQMEQLYGKVVEYAKLRGDETVLDLYCGVGTIGLSIARDMMEKTGGDTNKVGKVIGIESLKGAVLDANRNAVINGLVNATYICGRVEDILPKLMETKEGECETETEIAYDEIGKAVANIGLSGMPIELDVVIVDPPRVGCVPSLLEAIIKTAPKRIIYVSCDPATMARDIKLLCGGDIPNSDVKGQYEFIEATPVDMFPHTLHVETIVLLQRQHT